MAAIEWLGDDDGLYETDFPHPASTSPGPATAAISPREFFETSLGNLPESTQRTFLHNNVARIYRLDRRVPQTFGIIMRNC